MVIAINGPLLLARAGNAVLFLARRRHLWPALRVIERRLMGELFGVGTIFSLAAGLGNFLCHQYPIILVGRAAGMIEAGKVAVTLQALVVCSGLIQTVTSSVLPGMSDSIARGDFHWGRESYGRMLRFGLGFAFLIWAAFGLFGERIFSLWYGGVVHIPAAVALGLGTYFFLLTWETLNYSILLAAGRISRSSLLYLGRAALAAVLITVWGYRGAAAVYPCLIGSVLLVTFLTYYYEVRAVLQFSSVREETPDAQV
jgi:O-antigen/teichoic acid export membrane protein